VGRFRTCVQRSDPTVKRSADTSASVTMSVAALSALDQTVTAAMKTAIATVRRPM
jgi:hypothetical protein